MRTIHSLLPFFETSLTFFVSESELSDQYLSPSPTKRYFLWVTVYVRFIHSGLSSRKRSASDDSSAVSDGAKSIHSETRPKRVKMSDAAAVTVTLVLQCVV